MNENNLFDDNQNTNPFEQQTPNEVPAVEKTVVKEEQTVEIPVQETPAVDLGINVLNNVGANAPDAKQQVKKSVSKTPFIIIAVILLLSLFLGGGGYAVKTLVFDKAPNKVEIPEDDESHMIKEEDKENEEESEDSAGGENPEESEDGDGNETQNPSGSDKPDSGGEAGDNETLEEIVKKEDRGQTRVSIENFETEGTESATFYTNDDKKLFIVTKVSNDLIISVKEAVDGDVENGTSVEIYRRTFEPVEYQDDDGNIILGGFTIYGSVVNSYVLIKADIESEGTYMVFDKNMNLLHEGYYDYTTTPSVTDEAMYFPKIECGSTIHKYTIQKLDLNTGKTSNLKTSNYTNELMYCQ